MYAESNIARAPSMMKNMLYKSELKREKKIELHLFDGKSQNIDNFHTRLYEMQKVPKKIAPKNWAYRMKHHTCLVTKV